MKLTVTAYWKKNSAIPWRGRDTRYEIDCRTESDANPTFTITSDLLLSFSEHFLLKKVAHKIELYSENYFQSGFQCAVSKIKDAVGEDKETWTITTRSMDGSQSVETVLVKGVTTKEEDLKDRFPLAKLVFWTSKSTNLAIPMDETQWSAFKLMLQPLIALLPGPYYGLAVGAWFTEVLRQHPELIQ